MSTNLRKAQKHMQRATELMNQSQLGFGANDDDNAEKESSLKRKRTSEESPELTKKPQIHDEDPAIVFSYNLKRHSNVSKGDLYNYLNERFPTFKLENLILMPNDDATVVEIWIDSRLCVENKIHKLHANHAIRSYFEKVFGQRVEVRFHIDSIDN